MTYQQNIASLQDAIAADPATTHSPDRQLAGQGSHTSAADAAKYVSRAGSVACGLHVQAERYRKQIRGTRPARAARSAERAERRPKT